FLDGPFPDDVDAARLRGLLRSGVNRLPVLVGGALRDDRDLFASAARRFAAGRERRAQHERDRQPASEVMHGRYKTRSETGCQERETGESETGRQSSSLPISQSPNLPVSPS